MFCSCRLSIILEEAGLGVKNISTFHKTELCFKHIFDSLIATVVSMTSTSYQPLLELWSLLLIVLSLNECGRLLAEHTQCKVTLSRLK